MDEKVRIITLTLTQSCNLSCIYCYENHKSRASMSFETAKKILDKEFSQIQEGETLEIDLFGGEPFLEFNLMKRIVTYVREGFPTKNAIFFAITNGTLITEEVKNWLVENADCVICGLSIDGNREMQNINRCNSFDMIDLDFFSQMYPKQTVKMTVSDQTLGSLADGVLFLQSKGFEVTCNLAYGIDWSNEQYRKILERELMKLINFYVDHPSCPVCSMLNMGIEGVVSLSSSVSRYCGAGIDMCAYDVDGVAYPCQMFMPLSAGKEKARASHNITFYDTIPPESVDKKCQNCIIKSLCPTCYGSNYISTGNIYIHDESTCVLMKIIMKARSYLKGLLWEKGVLEMSEQEEAVLLRSISILQSNL